jgi:hypothetical protein
MFVVDYQAVFIDTVRKNIKQVCAPQGLLIRRGATKGVRG